MSEQTYTLVIDRGYTPVNDRIIDFLKPRIRAPYVDIGCNGGWLLSEVPGGTGVDRSESLVKLAAGHAPALVADAECLPFGPQEFDTAVLSCVLEQCGNWFRAIDEARRVARNVIGINPIPGASPWGGIGGWVKSVISEDAMRLMGCFTQRMDEQRYYFELLC